MASFLNRADTFTLRPSLLNDSGRLIGSYLLPSSLSIAKNPPSMFLYTTVPCSSNVSPGGIVGISSEGESLGSEPFDSDTLGSVFCMSFVASESSLQPMRAATQLRITSVVKVFFMLNSLVANAELRSRGTRSLWIPMCLLISIFHHRERGCHRNATSRHCYNQTLFV